MAKVSPSRFQPRWSAHRGRLRAPAAARGPLGV